MCGLVRNFISLTDLGRCGSIKIEVIRNNVNKHPLLHQNNWHDWEDCKDFTKINV